MTGAFPDREVLWIISTKDPVTWFVDLVFDPPDTMMCGGVLPPRSDLARLDVDSSIAAPAGLTTSVPDTKIFVLLK